MEGAAKDPELWTVERLIAELKIYDPSTKIDFSGLTAYRVKSRGPGLVQLEFRQTVHYDAAAKTWAVRDH